MVAKLWEKRAFGNSFWKPKNQTDDPSQLIYFTCQVSQSDQYSGGHRTHSNRLHFTQFLVSFGFRVGTSLFFFCLWFCSSFCNVLWVLRINRPDLRVEDVSRKCCALLNAFGQCTKVCRAAWTRVISHRTFTVHLRLVLELWITVSQHQINYHIRIGHRIYMACGGVSSHSLKLLTGLLL